MARSSCPATSATGPKAKNCIAITTSALRKKTISTAASHVPGTKKITPRAVTAATSTSHNRASRAEDQRATPPVHFEARLDFCLESLEMAVNAPVVTWPNSR